MGIESSNDSFVHKKMHSSKVTLRVGLDCFVSGGHGRTTKTSRVGDVVNPLST